ncbi:MAG: hypothetical protein JNN05_11320 [Candidatus Omnitrophica bacterium]|nr:hypothetical protein [Candidatus Omnitrophota bacterium]
MHSKQIQELEQDMVDVITSMETRGLNVDLVELDCLTNKIESQKTELDRALHEVLGISGHVRFNSSKVVSEILSSKLEVKVQRTKSGRPSTSRFILRNINNPITDQIISFRELEDLLSSLKAINKATNKDTGKIFCSYVDTCPSGRLYTKDYSFQSIPELARDVVYAEAGCSFVLADYDTFELRILSALSHDTYFKDCWARGLDLHRKAVSDMKGISYSSVTDKQRKLGKAIGFGISYGQEPMGLARNLHISIGEADKLMVAYKKNIPEIEKYKQEQVKKARIVGYSDSYYGRRRFLADINSPNISARKKAERQCINHQIQSTAADIVKMSMVKLHQAGFVMNVQLHDGILFTVPDESLETAKAQIKSIMETEINGLKFPVTIRSGKTWLECYGK